MSINVCSEARLWAAFAVLLAVVPVPLGANRPLAWTALAVCLGVLLVLWGVRDGASLPRMVRWLGAGWLAVVGWALVQAAPWTPEDWHHPLWAEAGFSHGAVALDPALAIEGAMRLLSYGAAFVLAFVAGRNVAWARQLVRVLAGSAA
ncbi:MAG: O-antigen ligase domain-containing protein, partial [Rhodospirillaceae bacterium]